MKLPLAWPRPEWSPIDGDKEVAADEELLMTGEGELRGRMITAVRVNGSRRVVKTKAQLDRAVTTAMETAEGSQVEVETEPAVPYDAEPKFLGVRFDAGLRFKRHIRELKTGGLRRVKVLKGMTGASWGFSRRLLKMTYGSYVRAYLEYGGDTVQAFAMPNDRKKLAQVQHAAARAISGCTKSVSSAVAEAEAGLVSLEVRAQAKAAVNFARYERLDEDNPMARRATSKVRHTAIGVSGSESRRDWRGWAKEALAEGKVPEAVERLPIHPVGVQFEEESAASARAGRFAQAEAGPEPEFVSWVSAPICRSDPKEVRRKATLGTLRAIHEGPVRNGGRRLWLFTDGSAMDGVSMGGSGWALWREMEGGEIAADYRASGVWCSSYRSEIRALSGGLAMFCGVEEEDVTELIVCSDSQSSVISLERGAEAQATDAGREVWRWLELCRRRGVAVRVHWVASHCGIAGNERADELAALGRSGPEGGLGALEPDWAEVQRGVPLDLASVRIAMRAWEGAKATERLWAKATAQSRWEADGVSSVARYQKVLADGPPVRMERAPSRQEARFLSQVRSGRCPLFRGYRARVKGAAEETAALCRHCGAKPEDLDHWLLECEALETVAHTVFGRRPELSDIARRPATTLVFCRKAGLRIGADPQGPQCQVAAGSLDVPEARLRKVRWRKTAVAVGKPESRNRKRSRKKKNGEAVRSVSIAERHSRLALGQRGVGGI